LVINLMKRYFKEASCRPMQLLVYRVAANMFSTLAGVNYMLHTPDHLVTTVEMIVSGLHHGDKVTRRAVATLCCNTALFLDRRHTDEMIQILSALVHVISSNTPSDDPDAEMKQLLGLGLLLYCNDEAVELARQLDLSLTQWLGSSNTQVSALAKDVTLLLR